MDWSIFQNFNILNIFKKAPPATNSIVELKKDDDYYLRHHLSVMEEIDKYKRCDIKTLSDSEILIIAEMIYTIAKDSGEKYPDSDMLNEELLEIKRVLLLEDIRIRQAIMDLLQETDFIVNFKGLRELDQFLYVAKLELTHMKKSELRKCFGAYV